MLLVLIILFFLSGECLPQENSVYIRISQAGFLPSDLKTGIVFSKKPINEKVYFILDKKGKIISEGKFGETALRFEGFRFARTLDFSDVTAPGDYRLRIKGAPDTKFRIDPECFTAVRDSLIIFFKVQRCGPTDPYLHEPCHLSDATRVSGYGENSMYDVTGGWHDAGDYLKFLSTAAYTTYMLIFSYEFDPVKFGFDNDENSVPDILEEARVGLDWLLRCRIKDDLLVTQVQDTRDHSSGWRLPEKDSLQFDRPAYTGFGKNIIGIYSAALAIGARVWSKKFYDYDFAARCLEAAESVYSNWKIAPDLDKVQAGVYQDEKFEGKLALGAAELYQSTGNSDYLSDAKTFADSAGSDYWWSWGNINSLAHYRLCRLGEDYSGYIRNNLTAFKNTMHTKLFGEAVEYTWGTTNSLLGAALQAILYKDLTADSSFDSLAVTERDYVTGRNPWGISFIYGIGNVFPRSLHSQIAYFRKGYLPGGMSAGPAPLELMKNYNIRRTTVKFDQFNTGPARYYDDFSDYISNEPTITGNATALFVYGFYSR